jgi:hypothetical protein
MQSERHYWFPAKRYGWGWGPPLVWQGWAVLAFFVVAILAGAFLFPPPAHPVAFIAYVAAASVVLTLVCWATGEPPRWRWGDK